MDQPTRTIELRERVYSKSAILGKDYASIRRIDKEATKRQITNIMCENPPLNLFLRYIINRGLTTKEVRFSLLVIAANVENKENITVYMTRFRNGKITFISDDINEFDLFLNPQIIDTIFPQLVYFIVSNIKINMDINSEISFYPNPLLWFKLIRDKGGCNLQKELIYIRLFSLNVYKQKLLERNPKKKYLEINKYIENNIEETKRKLSAPNRKQLDSDVDKWLLLSSPLKSSVTYIFWILEDLEHANKFLDEFPEFNNIMGISYIGFEIDRTLYIPPNLTQEEFNDFYRKNIVVNPDYIVYVKGKWIKYLNNARKEAKEELKVKGTSLHYSNKFMTDEELDKYYDDIGLTNRTYREYRRRAYIEKRESLLKLKEKEDKSMRIEEFVLSMPVGLDVDRYITKNATQYNNEDKSKISKLYKSKTKAVKSYKSKETEEEDIPIIRKKSPQERVEEIEEEEYE